MSSSQVRQERDPRRVLAEELREWWKSGKVEFGSKRGLATQLKIPLTQLYSYFSGRYFPSKLRAARLYEVTNVPSLHPANVAQTLGEAWRRLWRNPAWSRRVRHGMRRYWQNPEIRKKRGQIAKSALADPEVRRRISEGTRKGLAAPDVRRKISIVSKQAWANNPARREQARKTIVTLMHTPKVKKKARLALATPEVQLRVSEGLKRSWANNPARRQKTSQFFKKMWAKRNQALALAEQTTKPHAGPGRPERMTEARIKEAKQLESLIKKDPVKRGAIRRASRKVYPDIDPALAYDRARHTRADYSEYVNRENN